MLRQGPAGTAPSGTALNLVTDTPARALPTSLAGIARHYGGDTASFVALQLEYRWQRD